MPFFQNQTSDMKVDYNVPNSLPLVPVQSQINPVYNFPPYFPKTHRCIILGPLSDLFPSRFLTKILYSFLISIMHSMHPTHLTIHDLITQ
jgi:hypothetical protein